MKKTIILILVLVLSIILFIILGVDEQDLGDNYYYLPKYEAVDVGYPEGAIIYKSPQKYLYSDVKIHGDVISVNNNKDFIIAIQKLDSSYIEKARLSNIENDTLKYFIIMKKTDLVYGPYNKKIYLHKREELSVPKKLTLKEE